MRVKSKNFEIMVAPGKLFEHILRKYVLNEKRKLSFCSEIALFVKGFQIDNNTLRYVNRINGAAKPLNLI